ncbi:hypothetical protein [Dyadobacter sp. LHD-138]|uniref:hypothetical protein n=1 Tax=Dyadobacter sp. LHD-138 TaxID=3071413 RepID=UPI0027DFC267|nr:hypothetical protein [Dyadobacter sp. LHD-138]MDQ6480642.1 hypothetical protein [Dyadobacter sp. LHD-138]
MKQDMMTIYAAQSPDNLVNFNKMMNGGSNYHVIRNHITFKMGSFKRRAWFLIKAIRILKCLLKQVFTTTPEWGHLDMLSMGFRGRRTSFRKHPDLVYL